MKNLISEYTGDKVSPEIESGPVLLDLARDWLSQGNPVVAMELLKSATGSNEAERDPELKAVIYKETGRAMMMQSDWRSAEPYYQGAQRLFLERQNFKGAAECARNCANMYFQRGMYTESKELCEQALEWILALDDHQLRATVLNTLGSIQSATGDLKESLKTFRLCLADFQAAGNSIRQGYVLLNIGLSETELGDHFQAIQHLKEALGIAFTEKDLHLVEICYQNIARSHLAQNETILARSILDTARKILPGLDSRALETELNLIDCRIMKAMGDLERAARLLSLTLEKTREHSLIALEADVLLEQGLLIKDLGDSSQAACKLDAAAKLYQQLGMDRKFRETIELLESVKRRTNA